MPPWASTELRAIDRAVGVFFFRVRSVYPEKRNQPRAQQEPRPCRISRSPTSPFGLKRVDFLRTKSVYIRFNVNQKFRAPARPMANRVVMASVTGGSFVGSPFKRIYRCSVQGQRQHDACKDPHDRLVRHHLGRRLHHR